MSRDHTANGSSFSATGAPGSLGADILSRRCHYRADNMAEREPSIQHANHHRLDLMRTHFVIASAAWQSRCNEGRRYANEIATSLRSSQ